MILGIIYLIVAEKLAEWIKWGTDCMNFTVWNKKNCKFIQSVPGNCFLRMETGIFYELEFYLRCFIGSFLRFKIWAFVKSEHASKQVTGESTDGCVICPCCVIESLRSTLIRFSVPSNCACNSLKFSLAFKSG